MRRALRTLGGATAAALAVTLVGPVAPASAAPTSRYIVQTTGSTATTSKVNRLRSANAPVVRTYRHVFHGFTASLTADQANQLRSDPSVASVILDTPVHADAVTAQSVQSGATWGLDRIDQRSGLDGNYYYDSTGAGVTAYVIDTGIRMDQTEFGGRAVSGYDFVQHDDDASDCTSNYRDEPEGRFSHGTHVAGTLGGRTWGVARSVKLVSVRVLDCEGDGMASDVVAALDWVMSGPKTPSVVNLSLSGPPNTEMDAAVRATVAAGITVVLAAGNVADNACAYSPARTPAALTVGASDRRDDRAVFSNVGRCVDLFAPGDDIRSAGTRTRSSSLVLSGTSMAAPHVAGAVARYLQGHPSATPAQVSSAILGNTSRVGIGDRWGSPDRLLFVSAPKPPPLPRSVTVSRSDRDRSATIRWSAPDGNGGAGLSGYKVVRSGRDASGHASEIHNIATSARSFTFRGLRPGTTYTLSVQARNRIGLSHVAAKKIALTALPGTPRIVATRSGATNDTRTSVWVRWSPPTSGGPVARYVVTATRNGSAAVTSIVRSSAARSVTFTGLARTKTYTVRIRAVNDSGSGPTATSPWVTAR